MKNKLSEHLLANLAQRRLALGMSWDALAERSGVSRASICRLLKQQHAPADTPMLIAVAEALGVRINGADTMRRIAPIDSRTYLRQQAERQASKLVGMVQGTMGLESQALSPEQLAKLVKRTTRNLLAGSRTKLWYR